MKKTPLVAAAVIAAGAITLTGCVADAPAGGGDGTVTVGFPSGPLSLDPAKAANGLGSNFIDPAYASLLERDPNGEIVAGLADEWGYVGEGNTEFEISLRDGLLWADGTGITADDVVASLEYFKTGSGPSAQYFGPLSFEAVDEDTVSIVSAVPNPIIPDLLTPDVLGGAIISPAGLADPAKLSEETFGAGPYVYDSAQSVTGDTYVFTPNENYWAQDEIHFESITFKVLPNTNSAVEALRSGQVDFIQANADSAIAVEGDANLEVLTVAGYWAGVFLLDRVGEITPALADVRVRQAINFAVDRAAITQAVYGEYAEPTVQPITAGYDGYDASLEDLYPYDPDKARELLAEAGYAEGFTIPVNYGAFDPDTTKLLQAVQAQLAEVGITLELKSATNFGDWVGDLLSKQYAASVLSPGWGGSEFFIGQAGFMPGGIMNVFNAEDPELAAAFAEYTAATSDERNDAAQEVNAISVEHALSLPISAPQLIVIYNSSTIDGVSSVVGSGVPTLVTQWTSR
jgi:peptide/nickel transport system substrate-binding protein